MGVSPIKVPVIKSMSGIHRLEPTDTAARDVALCRPVIITSTTLIPA
ncbi:hypothetical protein HORIV_43030 [Vreelandella olivaria]|uniref:Uncharacterized protein n=1 Tax=Vreelandella olivaria TaxID=390919 RepID=A0ABN5WYH2_9GAMM|nr:hypothetical protein HORIV_43030 [Halomonas olivaria]